MKNVWTESSQKRFYVSLYYVFRIILELGSMNKTCQSCAMPMKKDPEGGGTNADGSKSTEYCSLCFQAGKFTQADFSAKEMQDFCIVQMKSCGIPRPLGWLFTRGIPKLRRWSQ